MPTQQLQQCGAVGREHVDGCASRRDKQRNDDDNEHSKLTVRKDGVARHHAALH